MDILSFTDDFLPRLVARYVDGKLPLHAMLDIDLWRQLFPDDGQAEQFHWYQISITSNPLQDGTLLLTFILPEPTTARAPKFAAIRIPADHVTSRSAILYILRKPASIFDQWDIYQTAFTPIQEDEAEQGTKAEARRYEARFCCKIQDTDSLRNFVFTVQQNPYDPAAQPDTIIDKAKQFFWQLVSHQ